MMQTQITQSQRADLGGFGKDRSLKYFYVDISLAKSKAN